MAKQFVKEEPWEPISEWGREFKSYLETQNIFLVVKNESEPSRPTRPRKPQQRIIKPGVIVKHCACGKALGFQNQSGICRSCRFAPIVRVGCNREGCMKKLNRQNESGLCGKHGHALRMKKSYYLRKKAA